VAVFFSFYHIKSLFPNSVVSLSAQPNRGLFSLFSSNYKNYKDTLLCVRGAVGVQNVMYSSEGEPLFPFYWTSNPRLVKGTVYESLSEFERDTVAYLESRTQMSPRDFLDAEGAPAVLDKYLSKCIFLVISPFYMISPPFLWLIFLLFLCRRYVDARSCPKSTISREGEGAEGSSRERAN
jgi:hypothetical protein